MLSCGARGATQPRAVMVLLSLHELTAAQIAELLECHPGTARRWIARFNDEGLAGLADRPRSGRPRLGGRRLTRRIAALLARPGPWTLPRIRRCLGWPQVSVRTLYRRVRLVAIWRRPKLTAAATLTMTTTMTTSSPESSPGCWNCPARRWCWRRMRRT